MANNLQQSVSEFERGRQTLASVSMQKNQLQAQSETLAQTIEELKNSKEEKVYKFAGSILIQSNREETLKDVETKKESVDLRLKSFEKQESILVDKLNKLRFEIEKMQGKPVKQESFDDKDESPTSEVS